MPTSAACSLITGLDIPTLILRLWVFPMAVLIVTLTVALTLKLSRNQWAASAAALAVQVTVPYDVAPGIMHGLNHFSGNSPSQYFAYPLMLLTVHALVDVAQTRSGHHGWNVRHRGAGGPQLCGRESISFARDPRRAGSGEPFGPRTTQGQGYDHLGHRGAGPRNSPRHEVRFGRDTGSVRAVHVEPHVVRALPRTCESKARLRDPHAYRTVGYPRRRGVSRSRPARRPPHLERQVAQLCPSPVSEAPADGQRRLAASRGCASPPSCRSSCSVTPGTASITFSTAPSRSVRHFSCGQPLSWSARPCEPAAMVVGGVIGGAAGFGAQLWTARAVPATDAAHPCARAEDPCLRRCWRGLVHGGPAGRGRPSADGRVASGPGCRRRALARACGLRDAR